MVAKEQAGVRLDHFLAAKPLGITRSQIKGHITQGWVTVNGALFKAGGKLKLGDRVRVEVHILAPLGVLAEPMPLEVLYEDPWLIVINKPAGIAVHPAPGHPHGTLVNGLLYHCKRLASAGSSLRPGIVHRLDKDTSGVLVVAKEDQAYFHLASQFQGHTTKRLYYALVHGRPKLSQGLIQHALGRDRKDRKKISPRTTRAREALTRYRVVEEFPGCSFLEIRPLTGRTHQIRVHLKEIGHPVVGDRTYGLAKIRAFAPELLKSMARQALHASLLGFTHPVKGHYLEFSSPLPPDMQKLIDELKKLARQGSS